MQDQDQGQVKVLTLKIVEQWLNTTILF